MSLDQYNKKRNFDQTTEPAGVIEKDHKQPVFVVQKHYASHLHYDFRLEVDGVLKSWAVPKGPSMNHSDKRLAVMVEDHPLEYANFHGEIAEGNYGAGSVQIWDSGTWEPAEEFKNAETALANGSIEFNLEGKRLKGRFVLIELKKSTTKNGWLLIKKHDEYSVQSKYDANDVVL